MSRNRLLLIGGAVAVVAVAVIATAASRRSPAPSPTPRAPLVKHYLINMEQAVSAFDAATAETTGSLRLRTSGSGGAVEALSVAIEAVDTAKGNSGPIALSLGEGSTTVTQSGETISASFPVRFWYPLLYQVGGEKVVDDVVVPERRHTGTAVFEGRLADGGEGWQATITLTPDPVEGTDFNLPAARIDLQSPVVFETDAQFRSNGGGGTRVWCVDVQSEANGFTAAQTSEAMGELRRIWGANGAAFLTPAEIETLNTTLVSLQPGETETRDPARLPVKKCYTVRLVKTHAPGGGTTADAARRTITIGANYRSGCPNTPLGRMMAHQLGHVALLVEQNEPARGEDNLMRACAPGETLDDDQKQTWWSYVAELPRELTLPGAGSVQNASSTQLETLLDQIIAASGSPLPTVEGSPTPTPSRTPTPTRRRTPAPTPTRTPAPSPTLTATAAPTPEATATATPTAAPTATPTATATASPSPSPT